jgi:hypothetical protein
MALAYAAGAIPERVSHLVIVGGFAAEANGLPQPGSAPQKRPVTRPP